MSEAPAPNRPFYVTGGTLKPGEPSYVERRADGELFESLLAGEFCYVLTARQMGKSSLMARTAIRLEQAGVRSAIVDLSQMGSERGDQASTQWYFGIANKIHQQLKIAEPLRPWWQERADLPPVQRLTDFFRELVLTHCPGRVVIFVDEIDSTIGLPFADDFFAALRACFNARATEPAFERLTFALLGVATPDQLIQDPVRTPFNIGRRIDLTDFSPAEARTLAPGLHADPGETEGRLERILYWTGGHPYLTQALCRAVRERAGDDGTAEKAVDPQAEELFLTSRAQREETNLKHARARLERSGPEKRRLLQLYRRVRQGKPVQDQPTSPLFAQLKLAGVVKATDEGRLAVRNRIYESVFTPEWTSSAMPSDRGWQLAAATLAVALVGVFVWYAVFQPRPYEEAFRGAIQADAYNVAFDAYKHLHANPFSRSRATGLMQKFWEHRALQYAQAGKRDESLLSYLQGLSFGKNERLRKEAQNLVGQDYERLQLTIRNRDLYALSISFSPDGRFAAMGSLDGNFFIHDLVTDKSLTLPLPMPLPRRPVSFFNAVTFSPTSRILATSSGDAVSLWDTYSGKQLKFDLPSQGSISAMCFSPDGRMLATASTSDVRWWDTHSGHLLGSFVQRQKPVHALAFSPDSRILAIGFVNTGWTPASSTATIVQFLDVSSGRSIQSFLPADRWVNALSFSPDGGLLAAGLTNQRVELWDTVQRPLLLLSLQHPETVNSVSFGPHNHILASGTGIISESGAAWLWDSRSGELLAPALQHLESVSAVAFSPNGRTLATGTANVLNERAFPDIVAHGGTIRLWDVVVDKPLPPVFQQPNLIKEIAISSDGRFLAATSDNGTHSLWDAISGKPLAASAQLGGNTTALAFSPNALTLATASSDGAIQLRNVATGDSLKTSMRQRDEVYSIAFGSDGRILVTSGSGGPISLWDVATGKLVTSFEHDDHAFPILAISPNARILATGSLNGLQLWDLVAGKPIPSPLVKRDSIYSMAFSPDSRTLAASGGRGIVLRDVVTGKSLTSLPPIQGWSEQTLAFYPSGNGFFIANSHWLESYSWDGKKAVLLNSQLLHGYWTGGFRFPRDCERCLQVALKDTGNSFHLETLHLDEPADPPIKGDPRDLLKEWQARLGLKFDDQMRPVPSVELPGDSGEDARRREPLPGARQR